MFRLFICFIVLFILTPFILTQTAYEISDMVQRITPSIKAKSVAIQISLGNRVGYGSGAIISPDGLILTCAHVTEIADNLKVIMCDGQQYQAIKLGQNSKNDYSLIKITTSDTLSYFELGNSSDLKLLEWVVALGHPGGPYPDSQPALAVGRIRAMHKRLPIELGVKFYDDAIQTDIPIFGGNSGGPLVNLEGKLVGINGAIMLFSDLAFAIPIDEIKSDIPNMQIGKEIVGRSPKNIFEAVQIMMEWQNDIPPQELQKMLDETPLGKMINSMGGLGDIPALVPPLGATFTKALGILKISYIETNSIAALAGLQVGDQILTISGEDVESASAAMQIFSSAELGEQIVVEVRRGREVKSILVMMDRTAYSRANWLREEFVDVGMQVSANIVEIFSLGELCGYGVIVDAQKGYILTAQHILTNDPMMIKVEKHSKEYSAVIVATNGLHNLALLQIKPEKRLNAINFGDMSSVTVGTWAISGGHEKGVFHVGMVSALNRKVPSQRRVPTLGVFGLLGTPNKGPVRAYDNVIQHDSDIDKDQFGTPLLDIQGKMIGINVSNFYRGTTLAIPISVIQEVLPSMKNGISVETPSGYQPYQPELDPISKAVDYFLNPTEQKKQEALKSLQQNQPKKRGFLGVQLQVNSQGAEIVYIMPGYAAEKAGFKVQDIIIQINGIVVNSPEKAVEILKDIEPKTEITVRVLRKTKRQYKSIDIPVVLDERPYQD